MADAQPILRRSLLDEDIAQQAELERLEARHVGRERAHRRFAAWLRREKAWINATAPLWTPRGDGDGLPD